VISQFRNSFKSGAGEGLLGYATFPSDYDSNPEDDGVVILFSSVPGGATEGFNLGQVSSSAYQRFVTIPTNIFSRRSRMRQDIGSDCTTLSKAAAQVPVTKFLILCPKLLPPLVAQLVGILALVEASTLSVSLLVSIGCTLNFTVYLDNFMDYSG